MVDNGGCAVHPTCQRRGIALLKPMSECTQHPVEDLSFSTDQELSAEHTEGTVYPLALKVKVRHIRLSSR